MLHAASERRGSSSDSRNGCTAFAHTTGSSPMKFLLRGSLTTKLNISPCSRGRSSSGKSESHRHKTCSDQLHLLLLFRHICKAFIDVVGAVLCSAL